jgi:HlyD family secretion protein
MATSKKRRKIIIFTVIGLVLVGLTVLALVRKREVVITVQTEKVSRRNINETVPANGKIQPVVQVNISPEVSGEIIALPFKEGQAVKKGDLILKINPDVYIAARNQAEASYKSSLASQATAEANLRKAKADFKRGTDLSHSKLISDSDFDSFEAAYDVAVAQLASAQHQVEMARASVASADEELAKTTIVSPLTGTVSKLNSEVGERVLGMVQNIGTEVMTIADLSQMEARIDIGEMDVILIQPGQNVKLEVDAFKDRKFTGTVTEVANSAKGSGSASALASSSSQEATKFEVRIRLKEKEAFRPGMSVTAEIETRSRTNVLAVPIASITTRLPKEPEKKTSPKGAALKDPPVTNRAKPGTNVSATNAILLAAGTNSTSTNSSSTNLTSTNAADLAQDDKKAKETPKPVEVVFVVQGDRVKMIPVKIGISDDSYWEVTGGLQEGQELVSGSYRAVSRDLEDGKKIRKGPAGVDKEKEAEKK